MSSAILPDTPSGGPAFPLPGGNRVSSDTAQINRSTNSVIGMAKPSLLGSLPASSLACQTERFGRAGQATSDSQERGARALHPIPPSPLALAAWNACELTK